MHNKQFIISKRVVNNTEFNNINLHDGYILSFEASQFKPILRWILGWGKDAEPLEPAGLVKSWKDAVHEMAETYRTWNGRWALLYKNEIHPDACAQLGIFYGKLNGELIVASSLALIAETYKGEYELNEYMPLEYNLVLSWVPGPYTVIKGINRLLPTQYLKVDKDFEVCFRCPVSKTDYSNLSVEAIYEKLFELQRCAFSYIEKYDFKKFEYNEGKKNTFNMGLTAGVDSRMQAALLKKMGIKFKAHTFARHKSTEKADNKYPQKLARILGIDWKYIPVGKRQAKRVIEFNRHTFDSVKDRDWKWHYTCGQYDEVDGDVIVSNSIWEAFGDYYIPFGLSATLKDNAETKFKDLKKVFETLDGNPLAEKSFKKYIEWVEENPINGMSWADRITFEQLMGIWDGNENLGKDLFSHDTFLFNPANSMEIFALILALPREKRIDRLWEKEIATIIIPEFKNIPYNKPAEYGFPFGEEIKDKKIILYGAGKVGQAYYLQIMTQKKCDLVAWADKNHVMLKETGIQVDAPENINDLEYDYLIVAVESEPLSKQITEELVAKGIERDRIIWKEARYTNE